MGLSKFMHPRNKYKDGIDFKKLAILYPEFRNHTTTDLSGKLRYDFKNEESLRVLAKTLLKHDFDLQVDAPPDKLVPAIPLRLNYVLWIEDLLTFAKLIRREDIRGIDIGTGAVCVYPLLCSKIYGWKMTATEISRSSLESANKNVQRNGLGDSIEVVLAKDAKLLPTEASKEGELYSFTMCNPPFFNVDESCKKPKRQPPNNAATGNKSELCVEGGEKSFVSRLISESLILRERVKIYTTMLGQKDSCSFFKSELKKLNIHNSTWTEFCQGRTKRWGLAWTFLSKDIVDLKNAPVIRTRDNKDAIKNCRERSSDTIFPLNPGFQNFENLIDSVKTWIRELKINAKRLDTKQEEFDGWACKLKAHEDSWSHARRKRRLEQRREESWKKSRLENPEMEKMDNDSAESKEKVNTDDAATISPKNNNYLECILMVGKLENKNNDEEDEATDFVKICLLYEDGEGGKNALETFRQYLINKLNIRQYLTRQNVPSKSRKKKKRKGKKINIDVND